MVLVIILALSKSIVGRLFLSTFPFPLGSELMNRAIMVVLSGCCGPGTCPGESSSCMSDITDPIGLLRRKGLGNDKPVAVVRRLTCRPIVSHPLGYILSS
jgi:hypothetical protein